MSKIPKLTDGEMLVEENKQLSNEIRDIRQRNLALLADNEELIRENNRLNNELERYEQNNKQLEINNQKLVDRNNELVEINNALKIVFQDDETRRFFTRKLSLTQMIFINMIIVYSSIFLFFITCYNFDYSFMCMTFSYK